MPDDVIVTVQLPKTLVDWFDTTVAERRLTIIAAGKLDLPLPTRSSFIRELLNKAKNR